MSIAYEKVMERLDVVKNIKDNPILCITDLFILDKSGNGNLLNLLYNVNFDGQYILDYLLAALYALPVFEKCKIKFDGERIYVYINTPFEGDEIYSNKGKIFKINLFSKTYKRVEIPREKMKELIEEELSFKERKMEEFWLQFGDFDLKTRLRIAFNSFSPKKNKTGYVRFYDFFHFLFIKRSKVLEKVEEHRKDLEERNAYDKRWYEEKLAAQEKYKAAAPEFFRLMDSKQDELVKFFSSYGYKEDMEMSDY